MNINKTLSVKNIFIAGAVLLLALIVGSIIGSQSVSAQDLKDKACAGSNLNLDTDASGDACRAKACLERDGNGNCTREGAEGSAFESRLNKIIRVFVNILSVIVGIVAVIMIIIGGLKFITSGGDSGKVSSAKQTVIYALIGLIIVALAQFIVRFVLSKTA